jgi:enoyl-CoA hydratase
MPPVNVSERGPVLIVSIDRPEVRNAVDGPTASALADAFRDFDKSDELLVGVLTGTGGTFCAGADLKAMATDPGRANRVDPEGDGPMGPSRMKLNKPVIAAIEGHAVAGGLELALWCDLRVAAADATLGFYDRRWGVPLIDGGTVRLPRLIGQSRAMDMLLTGRGVGAEEAHGFGLVNRVTDPQICTRADRMSAIEQWDAGIEEAMTNEFMGGMRAVASGETQQGAARFAEGKGRHGDFGDI